MSAWFLIAVITGSAGVIFLVSLLDMRDRRDAIVHELARAKDPSIPIEEITDLNSETRELIAAAEALCDAIVLDTKDYGSNRFPNIVYTRHNLVAIIRDFKRKNNYV